MAMVEKRLRASQSTHVPGPGQGSADTAAARPEGQATGFACLHVGHRGDRRSHSTMVAAWTEVGVLMTQNKMRSLVY